MTDMESLGRAVEEARGKVITARIGVLAPFFHDALDDLEAAVSAKARAEEGNNTVDSVTG